jgi:choline kinase
VAAKAIILAAGRGTRLRPLTNDRPKCLVELAGRSLLERQLEVLDAAGIEDVVVVAGYRAEMIEALGVPVRRNPDFASTNMVETLFCAEECLSGETDILVTYGDLVYETRVVDALLRCSAPVALAIDANWRAYWELRFADPLSDAETLKLDPEGRVLELGRKPQDYHEIDGQYMGLIKFRADYAARLGETRAAMDRSADYEGQDFRNMYMTSFLQHLIDLGWAVQSVASRNGWLEIDSVSDLETCEAAAASGELDAFCRLAG